MGQPPLMPPGLDMPPGLEQQPVSALCTMIDPFGPRYKAVEGQASRGPHNAH